MYINIYYIVIYLYGKYVFRIEWFVSLGLWVSISNICIFWRREIDDCSVTSALGLPKQRRPNHVERDIYSSDDEKIGYRNIKDSSCYIFFFDSKLYTLSQLHIVEILVIELMVQIPTRIWCFCVLYLYRYMVHHKVDLRNLKVKGYLLYTYTLPSQHKHTKSPIRWSDLSWLGIRYFIY